MDGPAYNPSGYTQDRPVIAKKTINLKLERLDPDRNALYAGPSCV